MPRKIRLASSIPSAIGALLLTFATGELLAQEGPAATMSDEAESNATADAPDGLNTAQQARMRLSDGNRAIAQGEKFEAKEREATDAKKKEELHAKAQKSYSTAASNFQAALKLDPKLTDAYIGLAQLLVKSGKFDAAIQTAEKALEVDSDSVKAMVAKGRAQLAGFKVPDAKATYDRLATQSAKEAKAFLAEMSSWLEAQKAKLGPEMATAVAELENWIKERQSKS